MEQILIGIICGYLLTLTYMWVSSRNTLKSFKMKLSETYLKCVELEGLIKGRRVDSNIPSVKIRRKPIVNSDEKIYQREQQQESRHGLA